MSVANGHERLLQACEELNFVDVGARWGVQSRFAVSKARIICFEPDGDECARLAQNAPPNVRYLPYGLADCAGSQTLYITREPACSSIYAPVRNLYRCYPQLSCIEPVRTVKIDCKAFDEVARLEALGPVTAMKLDTQGSELAILRGAKDALKTCSLIDIEVEFNPIYEGQALFCDIDRFLRDQGFVLWQLENLVHYSPEHMQAARRDFGIANDPERHAVEFPGGQLFWSQAQYVRATYPRTSSATIHETEGVRAAVAASLYGFYDLAIEILRKTYNMAALYQAVKADFAAA